MNTFKILFVTTCTALFFSCSSSEKKVDEKSDKVDPETETVKENKTQPMADMNGDGKILVAYVDGDVLNMKYQYLIEGRQELARMQEEVDKKLESKLRYAASREAALQKEAPLMTNAEKEKAMRELESLQRNYQQFEQQEMGALQNKQLAMNEQLYMNVQQVLKTYCEENKIDYVLNFQKGGPFLYVNNTYDITENVLSQLNDAYQKSKGQ